MGSSLIPSAAVPPSSLSTTTTCDSTAPSLSAPKSPAKTIVRAYLGDHGHTFVNTKPGTTVSEALMKAMRLRHLMPEACVVYRCSDPNKTPIPWDSDISMIGTEKIKVEVQESFPVMSSISHKFVRKTFTLAFCEKCRRLLFTGFQCRTCGYKFHQRCANGVPALCQQGVWAILDRLRQIRNPKRRSQLMDQAYLILAQSQTDRFPPDWNAWGGRLDEDDSDVSKDDSGQPKQRSLSTPNIPVHILSAPLDCPKIA